jgi:hypothetical protein
MMTYTKNAAISTYGPSPCHHDPVARTRGYQISLANAQTTKKQKTLIHPNAAMAMAAQKFVTR